MDRDTSLAIGDDHGAVVHEVNAVWLVQPRGRVFDGSGDGDSRSIADEPNIDVAYADRIAIGSSERQPTIARRERDIFNASELLDGGIDPLRGVESNSDAALVQVGRFPSHAP